MPTGGSRARAFKPLTKKVGTFRTKADQAKRRKIAAQKKVARKRGGGGAGSY